MPSESNDIRGWVYVIVNDVIPDRIKVGFTRKDPVERARELVSTGTTGNFVVIYHAWVANAREVEQKVHRRLQPFNAGLEWFSVCADRAVEEIRAAAGLGLYTEDTTPRWHPSQPEPAPWAKEALEDARRRNEAKRREAEEAALREAALAEEERIRLEQEDRRREEELAESRRREEERRQRIRLDISRRRLVLWQRARAILAAIAVLAALCIALLAIINPPMPDTVRRLRDVVKQTVTLLEQCQASLVQERAALQQHEELLKKQTRDFNDLEKSIIAQQEIINTFKNKLRTAQQEIIEIQSKQLPPAREAERLHWPLQQAKECRSDIAAAQREVQSQDIQMGALSRAIELTKATIQRSKEAIPLAQKQVEDNRQRYEEASASLKDAEAWWARLGASWIID